MSHTVHEEKMAAWRAFLQAHATVVRSLEREMQEESGLALTWYEILVHLERAPQGRMRMQELAWSVLLSRSGLTRLIDRMHEAGLVDRQTCSEDRRGTYAVITPAGRDALTRAAPGHLQGVQRHFLRHLSHEDARALRQALSNVLQGEQEGQSLAAADEDILYRA